jgi:hypothetical protein
VGVKELQVAHAGDINVLLLGGRGLGLGRSRRRRGSSGSGSRGGTPRQKGQENETRNQGQQVPFHLSTSSLLLIQKVNRLGQFVNIFETLFHFVKQ